MQGKPVVAKEEKKIKSLIYSVVIPVYRSEEIVGETIDRTIAFFESKGWDFEIILVNDNSPDGSWRIIRDRALADKRITAIDLIKNYGQHTANIVGFRYAKGHCVITMDDDLQNPPEEIEKLARVYAEGYDLVVGTFAQKKHSLYRRLGSRLMQSINRRIFRAPRDFQHTNFRLIDRSVLERINSYQNHYPYTSGLAMMFARRPANTPVNHAPRKAGQSNYNLRRLLVLAWHITFYYSKLPIRLLFIFGFSLSFISFLFAVFLLFRAFFAGSAVPGWTSLMFFMSIANVTLFFILSIIGEYLFMITNQLRMDSHFFVGEVVAGDRD